MIPSSQINWNLIPQGANISGIFNSAPQAVGSGGTSYNTWTGAPVQPQAQTQQPVNNQVLGESTVNNTPNNSYTPGEGNYAGWGAAEEAADRAARANAPAQPSFEDQQRNSIDAGWNSFISGLDAKLGSLSGAVGGMNTQANAAYNQGVNTLSGQQTRGLNDLNAEQGKVEQNQTKTLRDLSGNISNAMRAGSIFLGSQGAGDSSAANQYAYALTKTGTKERSNVAQNTANILSDIDKRRENVKLIFDEESRNLEFQKQQKLGEIAQWFETAKGDILAQKGAAGANRESDMRALSQNILNTAISAISAVEDQSTQYSKALGTWATGVIQNLSGAGQKISTQSQPSYNMPQAQNIFGTPTMQGGNIRTPLGQGSYAGWDAESEQQDRLAKGMY